MAGADWKSTATKKINWTKENDNRGKTIMME
jgi:hypothetical protein